jgi:hypothetical protein
MNLRRSAATRYRSLTTIALLLSGSLLPLLPALADQNSPPPGTLIENQATASFTDAADGSTGTIVSDKVSVTVAEVAGISAVGSAVVNSAYRTNTVFFDFKVINQGNDPTQLFVPAAPSLATFGPNGSPSPAAIPGANIGQLQVIGYNNDGSATVTPITTGNLVNTSTGSGTSALGVPNGGSIAAGGYIIVRVPVTVPANAVTNDIISVTLGNTAGQPANTSTPYIAGNNSGVGGNDLYTKDNTGTQNGDSTATAPINGEREASATQTTPVVNPPLVNIQGTVIDDANGSGTSTFGNILSSGEAGAKVNPAINAILVDSLGKVVATTPVNVNDGTYTLSTFGVQNGLYVILSTNTGIVGQPAPTPDLPLGFTNITPLTYAGANAFNVGIVDVTGKDFGIDQLPVTLAVNTASQANPPGATKYQVPTLNAKDGEDDPLGTLATIKTFNILTLPDPTTQGTLYYNNLPVAVGVITNYDPTKLTFDPVNGPVAMSFTYAAIDAAGKQDPSTTTTATMSFAATPITLSGTVYNDKNNSANNTFTNIQDNGELGTDAVFGTTTAPAYAVLTDANGVVLQNVIVNPNGTYSFTVAASSTFKVVISGTPGNPGDELSRPQPPEGWVGTSPIDSGDIITGFLPVTQDFGIRQKAKLVLVKRITKVNGQTINPNDGTVLTGSTTDTFNNVGNWPANYIVGKLNAGLVKPGDTIEYTVYFLNNQGADATGVKICDPIKGSQDFLPGSIEVKLGGDSTATALTDGDDSADRANYYVGGTAPSGCNADASTVVGADNGGVAISLTGTATTNQPAQTGIPGATGVATPAASYGLFRFSTTVQGGSTVTNTVVN